VAQDGTIYVTDAAGGRVLVFDPLELEETGSGEQ
jgi:DNA-binding beta-propeller fold protein YncE